METSVSSKASAELVSAVVETHDKPRGSDEPSEGDSVEVVRFLKEVSLSYFSYSYISYCSLLLFCIFFSKKKVSIVIFIIFIHITLQ